MHFNSSESRRNFPNFFRCDLNLTQFLPFFVASVVTVLVSNAAETPIRCDIFDLACRHRVQKHQQQLAHLQSQERQFRKQCNNFKDIWLIPGHADASCTRHGAKHLIEIDSRFVSIHPPVLKFPGCFQVEIKNIRINDDDDLLKGGLFGKAEYQWLNVKEFGDFQCQNTSNNGCGGFGNNCYYCDICDSLRGIDEKGAKSTSSSSSFAEQLKGLKCPSQPGYYTFRKEFCFNDWTFFDVNGDCRVDFLESANTPDVKAALSPLQQVGYGTIVAKIRLAYNASETIARKKAVKESQIEAAVEHELRDRRRAWDGVNDAQFEQFRQWYAGYRKDVWHREEYLPWLLYENEISCLRLTFNICERQPTRRRQFAAAAAEVGSNGGGSAANDRRSTYFCD